MKAKVDMLVEERQAARLTHYAMGTVMTQQAFGAYAEEGLAAGRAEIARLEGLLSRFLPDSDISRINEAAGMGLVKVSRETCEVLTRALEYSRACHGCLDVTITPLVSLWSEAKQKGTPPDPDSIRQILPLVNDQDLLVDAWEMTAGLRYPGQAVDLGGIGKGYAADRLLEVYARFGITSAYANLGGNVVTLGTKPDGSAWQIGIQHPRQEERLVGALAVSGQSVVTSGDYQRFFIDRLGQRWHHILDPKTGYPAETGLVSVTIVADRSVAADALSTLVFVAGMDKGLASLSQFPQIEAILVDTDLRIYITPGLKYRFRAGADVDVTILN